MRGVTPIAHDVGARCLATIDMIEIAPKSRALRRSSFLVGSSMYGSAHAGSVMSGSLGAFRLSPMSMFLPTRSAMSDLYAPAMRCRSLSSSTMSLAACNLMSRLVSPLYFVHSSPYASVTSS